MDPAACLPSLPADSRLLIIRLRSLGDIVLMTPALRLLKQWRQDLRLSVVVEPRFRELLEGNPNVEEILSSDERKGFASWFSRMQAVRELRRRKFALAVNLHGGPTSTLFTRFSGSRWRAGFEYYRSPRTYDFLALHARALLGRQKVHTAEHQAAIFFFLGLPRAEVPRAELFVKSEHEKWWARESQARGLSPGMNYAVVHPTALYATKQWAPEKFARLGEYLEREAGLVPVFSCGRGEESVLDAVERARGRTIQRLMTRSLGQFAAALAGARIFVGNDSGPAHMAQALGRPTVVIFGSSSSDLWGPWPPDPSGTTSRVVQNFYECNPCPGDKCYKFPQPECILSVTFEQVRDAVASLLAHAPRK